LNPELWPDEQLYPLALLLPSLQALAGTERGMRLALELLLLLPLQRIKRYPAYRLMAQDDLSLLGSRFNRLGIDCVVGNCVEDVSRSELILGPVSLNTYYRFQDPSGTHLLNQVLRLVMPCYSDYSIHWVVADPDRGPRLGIKEENAVLGINSYLSPQKELVS
jgi:predicted component of type VI protein secretion system